MKARRPITHWLLALMACVVPFTCGTRGARAAAPSENARAWTPEALELAARIPVQDRGRVKPLSTFAAFSLLGIHHTRSCKDPSGRRLEPTEWLLETLFFPERVRSWPLFRIDSHEVPQAIEIAYESKKKRDLYSYEELLPGRERLLSLSHSYAAIDAKDRTPVQGQVVNLGESLLELERLLHFLDFARARLDVAGVPAFAGHGRDDSTLGFSAVLGARSALVESLRGTSPDTPGRAATARLLADLSPLIEHAFALRVAAPSEAESADAEWRTPGELATVALTAGNLDARSSALIASLERLVEVRSLPAAFQDELRTFSEESRALASASGVLGSVDLEVSYYELDPFYRGLLFYLAGFLAVALCWLRPRMKRAYQAALLLTAIGAALNVGGIVVRCILRSRPPISTLYETVVFVTASAVLVALVIERIDRKRIAGSLAPLLGSLGLFLAMRFEEIQGTDTMPRLVAVLDTNFWLATHVTCITLGYSAGLLASAFAHLFVLGKAFGVRTDDRAGYRRLAQMVYGTLCFALIFSVVGTILGGVWANESWGRFWGWDPKENGALMIVLSQLAILHGRMGGHLRAFGICMATIAAGGIVAFSWWGVNLLGVGLHSYGFTQGIMRALVTFYGIETTVLLAGAGWWARQRWSASARPT